MIYKKPLQLAENQGLSVRAIIGATDRRSRSGRMAGEAIIGAHCTNEHALAAGSSAPHILSARHLPMDALLDSPANERETIMLRALAILSFLSFLWAGAAAAAGPVFVVHVRTGERRVGKGCVSPCRNGWA